MNEQLVVKNFGPIKDATVDFKRVTVFIGPTGGGKSTLAKLAAVFRAPGAAYDTDAKELFDSVEFLLHTYNILGYQNEENLVSWKSALKQIDIINEEINSSPMLPGVIKSQLEELGSTAMKYCKVRLKKGESFGSLEFLDRLIESLPDKIDLKFEQEISKIFPEPIYIPAERVFASAIEGAIFGLRKSRIALPEALENFMSEFENARKEIHFFQIPFLEVGYSFRDGENKLQLKNKKVIELAEGASGIQSVLPMLLVVEHLAVESIARSFIIEEPELNLFPTAQFELTKILVEKCASLNTQNELVITTHSPYVLTALNLMCYAFRIAQQDEATAKKVAKLIPRHCWIDPEQFAAYYVDRPDTKRKQQVRSIINKKTGLIEENELDTASEELSDIFNKLLRLRQPVKSTARAK